jgi:hypothetical protein
MMPPDWKRSGGFFVYNWNVKYRVGIAFCIPVYLTITRSKENGIQAYQVYNQ